MEGPRADSEEKQEPASDFDTALEDRLKALDPERPIREADIQHRFVGFDRGAARSLDHGVQMKMG